MKRDKGISLIVLVITIIVIIILAGSVILSLSNNNPIAKANEAKLKASVSEYNSELAMLVSNKYLLNNMFDITTFDAGIWDGIGSTTGTIKEYITSMTAADSKIFKIQDSKLVYAGVNQSEKDWLISIGIPNESGLGVNVIATVNLTVNGGSAAYNNPIVPKGFKAISDGVEWPTGWNSGLVIEDTVGNQFVWVPVDGTNVPYKKWCTTNISYVNTTDDTLPSGITNETNQITKYGGFYIARYEAGNVASVLVSKKNANVWNNINYINSKLKAELMYTTTEVKSGLLTGRQWDTTLQWIQNSGKSVIDSRAWANHNDSISPANISGFGYLNNTGFSEYWKANNIYDLAGNAWEWINEVYGTERIDLGGGGESSGITRPATYRYSYYPAGTDGYVTFREVLYIL